MDFKTTDACTGCGACVKDCPMVVLELKGGRPQVRAGREEMCIGCQHCVAVCPTGAAVLNGVGAADCTPAGEGANPVDRLLKSRRSIRQFAQEDLPRAEIDALLESLTCVPTGCNIRHLTYKVVSGRAQMEACKNKVVELLKARHEGLPDFLKGTLISVLKHPETDPFFRSAPHLLIVVGDPKAVTPQYDCVAACAYFDLLGQASGVGTCWCGFLKIILDAVPEAADIFGIPRDAPCYAMMFGRSAVTYARGVNRAKDTKIEYI